MVEIRKVSTEADFERLACEWNALLRSSAANCLFLTWEWLYTWWRCLGEKGSLHILVVQSEGQIVAIVPLLQREAQPLRFQPRTLEFLGSGVVGSDYLDFIVSRGYEAEVIDEVGRYLLAQGCTVKLSHYRGGSYTSEFIKSSWRSMNAHHLERTINVCPFVDLQGLTWETYLATLGREHRYNFRRRERRLKERFNVRVELTQTESERKQRLATLVALHNQRRKLMGGSEAFNSPQLCAFHDEVTRTALKRGWLRLYTLWLDQTPAASLYGFLYDHKFYFYQSGFDPHFGQYSVGLVLMGLAIQHALGEGAVEYDLLHGAEEYKFLWTSQLRTLGCLELYPMGVKGRLLKTGRELDSRARALVRKMLSNVLADRKSPPQLSKEAPFYVAGRS